MIESVAHGDLQFGEQGVLTDRDWAEVLDDEDEPFGPIGAGLEWQPKDRHVTFRSADGRLIATGGTLIARVEVGDQATFDVVGLGSVIVTRSQRGQGLMPRLVGSLLQIASDRGPDRAMLFCRPELVELYERFQFARIAAPVWVDQQVRSDGSIGRTRVEMPEPSMWRPLRPGARWPPGRVDVRGLPF